MAYRDFARRVFSVFRDPAPTTAKVPPGRYLLVYDDGCGFCTTAARWLKRRAHTDVELVGLSELDASRTILDTLAERQLWSSAHFVTPAGREYHGGEAITRALRVTRYCVLGRGLDLPGLRWVRAAGYRLVSKYRGRLWWLGKARA